MRIYRSSRVGRYGPRWRGKGAPPLPPVYQLVKGYPINCSCPSRLAIVGEGPGADEDQAGFPFVGRSGEELDRYLDTYGIDPDDTFITNLGRIYRTGNPDPTPEDIEQWEPLLKEELNAATPIWIAAVGRISTRYFLGDVDMDAVHGIPFLVTVPWLDNGRGGRVVVVPIVHPAAGFHNTEAQALIAFDFAQLSATIEGKLTPRQPELADRFPRPEYWDLEGDAEGLGVIELSLSGGTVDQPMAVAIDTEGLLGGDPWGLSYAVRPGQAFVVRVVHQAAIIHFYTCLLAGIEAGRIHVVLHNSLHDLRVLREMGTVIPKGSFTDTMVLAYHLCVEPQGLKPLAFRHCGMVMDSYDEIVSEAQDKIAVEYYELVEALVEPGPTYATPEHTFWYFTVDTDGTVCQDKYPTKEGAQAARKVARAKGYTCSLVKRSYSPAADPTNIGPFPWIAPYTILERDKDTGQLKQRTKQPVQIDRRVRRALEQLRAGEITPTQLRKRWADTDELVVDLVESVIGPMREADLNDVPLERAVRYAARDADATIRIYPILAEMHRAMGLTLTGRIDHAIIPMVDRAQEVGFDVNVDYFRWLSVDLTKRMVVVQDKIKAEFGVWINPNSGEQVADLLFRPVEEGGYGLTATKQTRGRADKETGETIGRRGSTVDKVLEGLRAEHAIIPLILEYRGLLKAKTSFVDVAIRRAKWERGGWVIHCNFRITRVSSGRLSATGPNLMAVMGGKLGEEVRKGYIAGKGYELAEWDLSQVEMRVMASEADDSFLLSMLNADEDIHTGTADRMFKLGLLRPYNKSQVDKYKRDAAKRTGFGIITGIQPPGLVDQMRLQGIIVTEEEAARWIADWLSACPAVSEYMHACHREAMAYGFVRDWAGRIRYLPGIHSPFRHIQAEAGRQSHSHKIQAGAQSILKVAMADIWDNVLPVWWDSGHYIEPVLQIHDSLMFRIGGFSALDKIELDAQIRASLFSATPPGFRVAMDAGNGYAPNWGELEH